MATIEEMLIARAKIAEAEAARLRERLQLLERLIADLAKAAANSERVS